jgi:hypothetical protein
MKDEEESSKRSKESQKMTEKTAAECGEARSKSLSQRE